MDRIGYWLMQMEDNAPSIRHNPYALDENTRWVCQFYLDGYISNAEGRRDFYAPGPVKAVEQAFNYWMEHTSAGRDYKAQHPNYRPVDGGINVEIAKLLGWKFEKEPWMSEWHVKIFTPHGIKIYDGKSEIISVDRINEVIPKFDSDMNEATQLMLELENHFYVDLSDCRRFRDAASKIANCWLLWKTGKEVPLRKRDEGDN